MWSKSTEGNRPWGEMLSLNISRKGDVHDVTNCLHSAAGGCPGNHVTNPQLKQLLCLCTEHSVCSFPYGHTSHVVFWEFLLLFPLDAFIVFVPKLKLLFNKTWRGEIILVSIFGKDILK